GFAAIEQKGSEHGDELTPRGFLSNNAGGTLGGISTGQDILVSIALKPTSSIRLPRRSIDRKGEPTTVQTTGRHDPCVGIRATPIAEAMLACVLMDHALRHRAQCGDVKPPIRAMSGAARFPTAFIRSIHWRSSGVTREPHAPRSIRSQTVFASSGESIGFIVRASW